MSSSTEHVSHHWAHNTKPHGHGIQGNMKFEGMAAYSYATIVAVKYPNKKGPGGTVLFADDGIYTSPTTNGHKAHYRQALDSDWTLVNVDVPNGTYHSGRGGELETPRGLRECLKIMEARLQKYADKVGKATKKSYANRAKAWTEFKGYLNKVNAFRKFLKLTEKTAEKFKLSTVEEEANLTRWNDKVASIVRTPRLNSWERNNARRETEAETQEHVEQWRTRGFNSSIYWKEIYLRLSKDGTTVETSKGASVPVDAGRLLFRKCQQVKASGVGTNFRANNGKGPSIGDYELRSISAEGDCTVGCHNLKFTEMELLYTTNPE